MLGSITGDFEDVYVDRRHFQMVNEHGATYCSGTRHSHTMTVYGRAENAKKDAPYKMGRRSGRKTEATKKATPLSDPVDAKCICGTKNEYAGIGVFTTDVAPVGTGRPFGEPHLCAVGDPLPHLQGRCFADASLDSFRLGDGGREHTVHCEAEGSEKPERGGGNPGQDCEAKWVCYAVNNLLGEGFDRFDHVVVNESSVRWEVGRVVIGREK